MATSARKQKILVIDDMQDMLKMLEKHLESWGYIPMTALTGEEGLRIAESEIPDLILLDMLLPKMKGMQVCSQLKSNPKTCGIPIIFLTGLTLAEYIKTGMELGADDYITKPFEAAQLKERIRVCLWRKQGQGDK
jgi:DNA-binding response OmpR family regulator